MDKTYIHKRIYCFLKKYYNKKGIVNIAELHYIISMVVRAPKRDHYLLIDELIQMNLLSRIDKNNYLIKEDKRLKSLDDWQGNPLWGVLISLPKKLNLFKHLYRFSLV